MTARWNNKFGSAHLWSAEHFGSLCWRATQRGTFPLTQNRNSGTLFLSRHHHHSHWSNTDRSHYYVHHQTLFVHTANVKSDSDAGKSLPVGLFTFLISMLEYASAKLVLLVLALALFEAPASKCIHCRPLDQALFPRPIINQCRHRPQELPSPFLAHLCLLGRALVSQSLSTRIPPREFCFEHFFWMMFWHLVTDDYSRTLCSWAWMPFW